MTKFSDLPRSSYPICDYNITINDHRKAKGFLSSNFRLPQILEKNRSSYTFPGFEKTLMVLMLVYECYNYFLSKHKMVSLTSWIWSNNAIQVSCKFLLAIPTRTAKTKNQVLPINPHKFSNIRLPPSEKWKGSNNSEFYPCCLQVVKQDHTLNHILKECVHET